MSSSPAAASDVTRTAGEEPAASSECLPSVGTIVGQRYRLTRVIGEGGMGTVFEAEITSVGRRCAVKLLRRELAGRSRSAPRFEREARLLARLEHEHITAVFDYGWFGERTPFFVMEYLDGCTLRQRLSREGALPIGAALELMRQACRGMAHAHAQGVVHRDLKPDNMMIARRGDGRPWLKILDFGVASSASEPEARLTPTGAELGTAHYMAPEQARGARNIDARADVYALGAILYEVLVGKRLYDGASYNEVLFQVITQPHAPLERVLSGCPAPLVAVVDRCLQKDAAERFRDAGELLAALSAVQVEGEPEGAASSQPLAEPAQRGRRSPARARSSTCALALGGCALLALSFWAGARWSARSPHEAEAEAQLGALRPAAMPEPEPTVTAASQRAARSIPSQPAEPAAPTEPPESAQPTESAPSAQSHVPPQPRAEEPAPRPSTKPPASALRPAAAVGARGGTAREHEPPHAAGPAPGAAGGTATPALPLVTANPYRQP